MPEIKIFTAVVTKCVECPAFSGSLSWKKNEITYLCEEIKTVLNKEDAENGIYKHCPLSTIPSIKF